MDYAELFKKYAVGAVIEVSGADVKSDNGKFRISTQIESWGAVIAHRLNAKGEEFSQRTAFYCREYKLTRLEKFARVVS